MARFRGWGRSFRYAGRGLGLLFVTQPNARIHLLATLAAVLGGLWAKLSVFEWMVLTLTVTAVIVAEALNTAVEFLADAVMPERHPLIKKSKDIAAGAVLLTAVTASVVGIMLFGPRLW